MTGANSSSRPVSNVPDLLASVKAVFSEAIRSSFGDIVTGDDCNPIISAANPKFGDYQCNNAMAIFKKYKPSLPADCKSPKVIADKIVAALQALEASTNLFDQQTITAAPQGFISVKLQNSVLENWMKKIASEGISFNFENPVAVAVDFSSPNIAKEMHVGHLRSTIVGESICRILEFLKFNVSRINHLGDWGTQFGMLIEYMKEKYPDFQTNPPELSQLCEFYKASKKSFDEDPEFKTKARKTVVALQSGDQFAIDAWKLFCKVSLKDFNRIYERLGVHIESRGESFYNSRIPGVIAELDAAGLIKESQGAKCLFTGLKEDEVPLMVQKSDGGYGYDSTDLCAIRHRLVELKNDWLIYITDVGQYPHFVQVFEAAKLIGWHNPPQTRVDHMGLGLVCGADGKKFKTRSGDTVRLSELLDEAVARAKQELDARQTTQATEEGADGEAPPPHLAENDDDEQQQEQDKSLNLNKDLVGEPLSREEAAGRMGMAAVKYFDLRHARTSNYNFSFDSMLDPKGNTAVYLLYAYARICSIFRKSNIDISALHPEKLVLKTPEERNLAFHLLKLVETIMAVLDDLMIHRISDFMYQACVLFTDFYQKCKIIGHEDQDSRLILCESTRRVLLKCFQLLTIEPLPQI